MTGISFDGAAYQTSTDADGQTVITWLAEDGKPSDVACYGWIAGGEVFAPADGQYLDETVIGDDGQPDPLANWYHVGTGRKAITGLPGATLTDLA